MDETNTGHLKALLCEIKYVIDTNDYCCQMKPDGNMNGPRELRWYIDAYYAGDNETRKSVAGYIVLINVSVIAWCSWRQKTVTIYVTEAEYSAIREVCFEILFVCAIWFLIVFFNNPLPCMLITLDLYSYRNKIIIATDESHRRASPLHSWLSWVKNNEIQFVH